MKSEKIYLTKDEAFRHVRRWIRDEDCYPLTFMGFSGDYAEPGEVEEVIRATLREKREIWGEDLIVCCGATTPGIGMVYDIAVEEGYQTMGIVSSKATEAGATTFHPACRFTFIIEDDKWGGRDSLTSEIMALTAEEVIKIGGGPISEYEAGRARDLGLPVFEFPASAAGMDEKRTREEGFRMDRPVKLA